jgi:ATP-dependent helicase HrpB
LLSNGRGALLRDEDALASAAWLVAADMDGQAREARIFLAAEISLPALEEVLAPVLSEQDVLEWDAATQSVIARRQRRLGALVLDDKPLHKPDPAQIRAVMLRELRSAGLGILPWTDTLRQLQARISILHRLEPQHCPDFSDAGLLAALEDWAAPFLDGMSRFSHLAGFPLSDALLAQLEWAQQQMLDDLLPVRIEVPTGSMIAVDYTPEHGPVLAVKLQEMFGLMATPQLARGRVPLTIHLLSPAQRPVAVTRDLASFWKNAYSDVRKDMRGRYPRHPWPEDPFTAVAQRGVKRRPG